MSRWSVVARSGLAGCALALALAGTASACTPQDYLTPEELASGQYDTTPPAYEAGWDAAAHTHGAPQASQAPSPAPASRPTASAPEPAAAPKKRTPAGASTAPASSQTTTPESVKPSATEPERARSPSSPNTGSRPPVARAPAATVTSAPAADVHAAPPRPPAMAAPQAPPRVRAAARSSGKQRVTPGKRRRSPAQSGSRTRQKPQAGSREPALGRWEPPSARRPAARPAALASTSGRPGPRKDGSWSPAVLAALGGLTALLLTAAARRRRRPGGAPVAAERPRPAPDHDAAIEAELQELIALEAARRGDDDRRLICL